VSGGASYDPLTHEIHLTHGVVLNLKSRDSKGRPMKVETEDLVYKEVGGLPQAAINIYAKITNVSGRRAGLFEDVVTSSFTLVERAAEGPVLSSTDNFAEAAPFSTRYQFRTPLQSERKVRLRTSSAYNPPSYE